MRELWIHAGMPKNGSSAIQVFLAKNAAKLKKEDLDYIELSDVSEAANGEITSGNAALFARTLLNEKHEAFYCDNNDLIGRLFSYIENTSCEKILLSSEFFAVVPVKRIEELKIALIEKNVILKFIYYVRRQDQFLMSSYMQRVKRHGLTAFPEEFILNSYKNIPFLKYYSYAKKYEEVLGKKNLLPFIFENTRIHEKGLIGHFIEEILGYCPDWLEDNKSINTSPSPLELRMILASNQYNPRMRFSDFIIEDSIRRERSKKYQSHNIVSNETVHQVMDYFAEQNRKFCKKFTENETFPTISDEKSVSLKDLNFTNEELMDVLSGLIVRYDKRLAKLERISKK